MGRTQLGPPLNLRVSASSRDANPPLPEAGKPTNGVTQPDQEWDFYSKADPNRLQPSEPAPVAAAPVTAPASVASSPSPSAASKSLRAVDTARPATPLLKPQPVNANSAELRRFQAPRISHGQIVLQLAALSKEADALSIADAAQQKHFPSFIVTPSSDKLYRVEVGPYADMPSAERAKDSLDHAGFKAIIRR